MKKHLKRFAMGILGVSVMALISLILGIAIEVIWANFEFILGILAAILFIYGLGYMLTE